MKPRPLIAYSGGPFGGPFAFAANLLDAVTAAPFEGIWVPTWFTKDSSIEVVGTFSALDIGLWGTNASDPLNSYVVTLGGTAHTGDVPTLTFTNPLLPTGQQVVTYTLVGGDTLNSSAAALAAAVQGNVNLAALGVRASAVAAVVTITWPSASPNAPAPMTPSSPPISSEMGLVASVTGGGATTTLTASLGTDGAQMTSLNSVGLISTPAAPYARWTKCRLNSFTGTSVTARLAGAA